MINVTDVVYAGNGFTASFDDGSQATGINKTVNGRETLIGLNNKQLAAYRRYTSTRVIETPDPRFTDNEALKRLIDGDTVKTLLKEIYDADENQVVDSAENAQDANKLGSKLPSYYHEADGWRSTTEFTAAPVSTSQIAISDSDVRIGMPIKWTDSGGTHYAMIKGLSGGEATIVGPPADQSITALWLGSPALLITGTQYVFPGEYAADPQTNMWAINGIGNTLKWDKPDARILEIEVQHSTGDTGDLSGGSEPSINVNVSGGSNIFSSSVAATTGSWNDSGVTANESNNKITYGDDLRIPLTQASGNAPSDDATILEVKVAMIYESLI